MSFRCARRSANPPVQNVYVTIPADFGTTNKVQINDDAPFSVGVLPERMRQALLQRTDKSVFVRADQAVTIAFAKLDGDVFKQRLGAELHRDVSGGKH